MSKWVQMYKPRNGRLDVFATLFGGLVTLSMIAIVFVPPQVTFLNHAYVVSQGAMGMALLTGALFWALIEMYTPPGVRFLSLVIRFFAAMLIGGVIGGFLGQEFFFGQYVLIPVSLLNPLALFLLAALLTVFIVLVISAVWNHNSTYLVLNPKKSRG